MSEHEEGQPTPPEELAGLELDAVLGPPLSDARQHAMADELRSQLEGEAGGVRARLHSLPTPLPLLLAWVLAVTVALAVAVLTPRPDLGGYPTGRLSLELILLGAVFGLGSFLVLRPLYRPPLRWGRSWLAPATALLATGLLLLVPAAEPAWPAPASFVGPAVGCFVFGMLTALPFVLLLLGLDRRAWRSRQVWHQLLAAAAIMGVLGLLLHCPISDKPHLLLGHGMVPLLPLVLVFLVFRGRR